MTDIDREPRTFLRYSVATLTLAEAWEFVMRHVDEFERPNIEIKAASVGAINSDDWVDVFNVTIYGDVSD